MQRQKEKTRREDREFTGREHCPSKMVVASSSQEQGEQPSAWHTLNNASLSLQLGRYMGKGSTDFCPLALLEI